MSDIYIKLAHQVILISIKGLETTKERRKNRENSSGTSSLNSGHRRSCDGGDLAGFGGQHTDADISTCVRAARLP